MLSIKVKDAIPLSDMQLLVFFENDVIKLFDVKPIIKDYPEFEELKNEDLFNLVKVEPGGYGISWSSELDCSEGELWEDGVELPITPEFFINFVKYGIINTKDACDLLDCSRQKVTLRKETRQFNYLATCILTLKKSSSLKLLFFR